MRRAVDVHVEISRLKFFVLRVVELRSRWDRPGISALGECDDNTAVLSGGPFMDMGSCPIDARCRDTAADRFILSNSDRAVARRFLLHWRPLFTAGWGALARLSLCLSSSFAPLCPALLPAAVPTHRAAAGGDERQGETPGQKASDAVEW